MPRGWLLRRGGAQLPGGAGGGLAAARPGIPLGGAGRVLTERLGGATSGTGTFGRVRIVKHQKTGKFLALKTLKKNEIIRLKQVEHILSEKQILGKIEHPFIVNLCARAPPPPPAPAPVPTRHPGRGRLALNLASAARRAPAASRGSRFCPAIGGRGGSGG